MTRRRAHERVSFTARLKYIELKTGQEHRGPAWIARVTTSRSGTTVYFNGKALKQGRRISGNHFDASTGKEYWVSGIKKDGSDRHWAGAGKVSIEKSAVDEYLDVIGATELDRSRIRGVVATALARARALVLAAEAGREDIPECHEGAPRQRPVARGRRPPTSLTPGEGRGLWRAPLRGSS